VLTTANVVSALLPTPFDDDEDGGFGCASDWALAPLHARSNSSAHILGNVRMDTVRKRSWSPDRSMRLRRAVTIGTTL